jgi:hypothetical protein
MAALELATTIHQQPGNVPCLCPCGANAVFDARGRESAVGQTRPSDGVGSYGCFAPVNGHLKW